MIDPLAEAATIIEEALGPPVFEWPTSTTSTVAISAEDDPEATMVLVHTVGDGEIRVYPCRGVDGVSDVREDDQQLAAWSTKARPSEADIQAIIAWLWGSTLWRDHGVIPGDLTGPS